MYPYKLIDNWWKFLTVKEKQHKQINFSLDYDCSKCDRYLLSMKLGGMIFLTEWLKFIIYPALPVCIADKMKSHSLTIQDLFELLNQQVKWFKAHNNVTCALVCVCPRTSTTLQRGVLNLHLYLERRV